MSTLSKVLIVLLVVMSLVFSTLTIGTLAQTPDWRTLARDYKTLAEAKRTERDLMEVFRRVEVASREEQITALITSRATLERDLAARVAELADVNNRLTQATESLSTQQAMTANLSSQIEAQGKEIARLVARNETLQTENADISRINLDQAGYIKELTTNIQSLEAKLAALTQQNASLRETNNLLEAQLEASGRPSTALALAEAEGLYNVQIRTPLQAVPIRARITGVRDNLATISVGSAAGVGIGKTFTVFRTAGNAGKYLATLTIEQVQADEAVGTLTKIEGPVQVADEVADRLE